ncbi:MAG: gliding motility-associated C-terminal domain-containing protein [Bacteroidia bacterium]
MQINLRNLYILLIILPPLLWRGAGGEVFAQGFIITTYTYQTNCNISSIKVKVTGNTPPYTYAWGNGMAGDSISNLPGGVYAVHITDSLGEDTTLALVLPLPPCQVTARLAFTPNGDGINDTWSISHTELYPNFLLQVFDRWGQTVHTQKHQYIPWEGTQLGINLSDATYYYIFFYEEGNTSRYEKGSVTIVR